MNDTPTEKELPQEEVISRITLELKERVSDGAMALDVQFNETNSATLAFTILQMVSTAFKGDDNATREFVSSLIPYINTFMKNREEVDEGDTDGNGEGN